MIKDYLRMAIENVRHRGVRSWLTLVGIFIGIAAVVAVVSLGQGLQAQIDDEFSQLGYDKILVQPGSSAFGATSTAANLTERDRKEIERVRGVDTTVGYAFKSAGVESDEEREFELVVGYTIRDGDDLWQEMYGDRLIAGRWLEQGETGKAVVGYNYGVEDKIFSEPLEVGDSFFVAGQKVDIVGMMEKIGTSTDDGIVYLSEQQYEQMFQEQVQQDYKVIIAKTAVGTDPAVIAERMERDLRDLRDRDEGDEDFTLQTTEELQESAGAILDIINIVVIGIALISLIVGGIGIMNTMFTAVLERTKEIGIMKAIGARNSDILTIFLIESAVLGLIGGVLGVLMGLGMAKATEWIGTEVLETTFLSAWWNWQLVVAALLFAMLVGILSGILPARQASRQQAADSLRYE